MDLGYGSGGKRRAIEALEQLGDRMFEAMLNLANRFLGRKRRDVILQGLQGRDVCIRQHVAAHAQGLTELDEGRSESCQGES